MNDDFKHKFLYHSRLLPFSLYFLPFLKGVPIIDQDKGNHSLRIPKIKVTTHYTFLWEDE